MGATFHIDGLDEVRAALRRLPDDLAGEARHIIQGDSNAAGVDIRGGYQQAKGDLSQYVEVAEVASGRYGVAIRVTVKSTLAHIFENGTQVRHTHAGASRGAIQPPQHVFIPRMMKWRRRMWAELADLLTRHGLLVAGEGEV